MEDAIGRSIVIHINKFFSCCLVEKHAAGNMIPFLAILLLICLRGRSQIIDNPHSGTSFSVKKNESRAALLIS